MRPIPIKSCSGLLCSALSHSAFVNSRLSCIYLHLYKDVQCIYNIYIYISVFRTTSFHSHTSIHSFAFSLIVLQLNISRTAFHPALHCCRPSRTSSFRYFSFFFRFPRAGWKSCLSSFSINDGMVESKRNETNKSVALFEPVNWNRRTWQQSGKNQWEKGP